MNKTHRLSVLVLIFIMYCTSVFGQTSPGEQLDQFFEVLKSNNKFMGSVSIYKNGTEIYSKSVGYADIESQKATDRNSRYCIGSISKTFTAVMIFKTIEAGKLSLDDTIEKYFPSIQNAGKITIRHLLSHRSGIYNFTTDENFSNWSAQPKTQQEMLAIIVAGGTNFEPDTKEEYSNSGYVLLSYILESIHGKPYAKILAEQITTPLSLKNTYLGTGKVDLKQNECNSYVYFDKWRIESVTNPTVTFGAGGIISTPGDMNKFAHALFNKKLVAESSLDSMKSVKGYFGMGLTAFPFYTEKCYGHSGGIDGYRAMLIYCPTTKISYALASNGCNYNLNDIHLASLCWAHNKPFDVPDFEVRLLKPEELDKYVGVYASDQIPIKLTVTKSGNSLTAQGTGQAAFSLEANKEHIFKFSQAGIVMEFKPEENAMILKQNGGVFYFKKE